MVEVISMLLGFLIGLVAAGIAVELGLKKFLSSPETGKLTRVWSLSELPSPLVAATLVEGVAVPQGARVLTTKTLQAPRTGFDLRTSPELHANFAVDAQLPRALLFLDGVRPGGLALWTVDEPLIERLRTEFNRLWSRSSDYVEHVKLAEVIEKANLTVETHGTVQEVVPYRGHWLLRLSDEGETVGVLVAEELPLRGRRVAVKGIVRTSSSGYPLVEALEVRAAA